MTFKVCNHGSKYPYLLHKMGFVDSQFGTTVPPILVRFEGAAIGKFQSVVEHRVFQEIHRSVHHFEIFLSHHEHFLSEKK